MTHIVECANGYGVITDHDPDCVRRMARALYEAYHFEWYGGHKDGGAPPWDKSPSQMVWFSRAVGILDQVAEVSE